MPRPIADNIPERSPSGHVWIAYDGRPIGRSFFQGYLLDTANDWYAVGMPFSPPIKWVDRNASSSGSIFDSINDIVVGVGLSALAALATAVLPGVVAIAGPAIVLAVQKMARGGGAPAEGPTFDAIRNAVVGIYNHEIFDTALDAGKTLAKDAIDRAAASLVRDDEQAKVFSQGVALGVAQSAQSEAASYLKSAIGPERAPAVDNALRFGGNVIDVAHGFEQELSIPLLDRTEQAINDATARAGFPSSAASSSSSGGASSSGGEFPIVPVALFAGAAFFLWKFHGHGSAR